MAVTISLSHCRFGGKRPYFICPTKTCGRKVQHLYPGYPYFVCRHCMDLTYTCQREQCHHRAIRRARKLRERAGDGLTIFDGPILMKPKGMHWKTFHRLQSEEEYYRKRALVEMARAIDML